jgi:hypothetical protein
MRSCCAVQVFLNRVAAQPVLAKSAEVLECCSQPGRPDPAAVICV